MCLGPPSHQNDSLTRNTSNGVSRVSGDAQTPLLLSLSLPHFLSFCLSKLCLLAYFSLYICNLTLLCISCAFLAPFCFSFLLIFHSFLIFPLAFVPPVYKCPAGVCVYLSVYLSVFATIFQEVFCLETCLYVSSWGLAVIHSRRSVVVCTMHDWCITNARAL